VSKIHPDLKQGKSTHGFMLHVCPNFSRRLEEESVLSRRSITSIAHLALQDWIATDSEARQNPDAHEVKSKLLGKKRISIRIEERLRFQLKIASSQLNLSMNKTLIGIIDSWLADEKDLGSATVNLDGSCSIELPPRLFREVSKLIHGATREDIVRMCLREMCFGTDEAVLELSTLMRASDIIKAIGNNDHTLVDISQLACLSGGARDVLSRVRLRYALIQCLSRLGVELNTDADGQSILTAIQALSAGGSEAAYSPRHT